MNFVDLLDILSHQANESSLVAGVAESELKDLAHINLKSILIGESLYTLF